MDAARDHHRSVFREGGRSPTQVMGETGLGVERVPDLKDPLRAFEDGKILAGLFGEIPKNPLYLFLLFFGNHHQLIIHGHRFNRLDEGGLVRARRSVNHAFERTLGLGLDHQDRTPVAGGNDLVLKHVLRIGSSQVGLEDQIQILLQPVRAGAQPPEFG